MYIFKEKKPMDVLINWGFFKDVVQDQFERDPLEMSGVDKSISDYTCPASSFKTSKLIPFVQM